MSIHEDILELTFGATFVKAKPCRWIPTERVIVAERFDHMMPPSWQVSDVVLLALAFSQPLCFVLLHEHEVPLLVGGHCHFPDVVVLKVSIQPTSDMLLESTVILANQLLRWITTPTEHS